MYVTPPGQDDFFIAMPLGIIYLGAILREAGCDVECCDERVCTAAEVEEYIATAEILGLSALTPHVNRAIRYAEKAKQQNPDVVTVMGGPHATVDVDTFLDSGSFDYVIGGEAEDSIVDFARGVDQGRDALADVPGIANFSRLENSSGYAGARAGFGGATEPSAMAESEPMPR